MDQASDMFILRSEELWIFFEILRKQAEINCFVHNPEKEEADIDIYFKASSS